MKTIETTTHDEHLVRATLRGDAVSIERFGLRLLLVPRVLAAYNARNGRPFDPHELADLTQEVLTIVWGKLATFDTSRPLDAWLYRIALYEALNQARKKRRRERLLNEAAETIGRGISFSESPAERYEDLHLGLAQLEEDEAAVIRLRHFDEHSFEDAAACLGIPVGTAKTRYYRGILRLRGLLSTSHSRRERDGATH